MKICLIVIGETQKKWVHSGEMEYIKRISHYIQFQQITIPDTRKNKNFSVERQKEVEGDLIMSRLSPGDMVVLLDERGKELTSREMSVSLQKYMNMGLKRLVFIIGGPYGFPNVFYDLFGANMLSISKMTFPHDLIRVMFVEQLYRALTLLNNEPYHHD